MRRLGLILILQAGLLSHVHAAPSIRLVKTEPKAASGACTPKSNANLAHEVMKRFDLDIVNGKDSNKLALSRGLLEIEKLAGGRFRAAEGATFKILPESGCAQQLGKTIVLRQGCGSLDSVAYYIHELGHYIGNNDRGKLYASYKASVTSRCAVSRYAMTDWTKARARNEEFAEVIAAFVTNPDLLLKSGPSCVKAFNFFRDEVFDKGELASCKPDAVPSVAVAAKSEPTKTPAETKPGAVAKPVAETKSGVTVRPAVESKPAVVTKPVAEVKPVVVAKPSVKAVTSAAAKPAPDSKPAAKPATDAKPSNLKPASSLDWDTHAVFNPGESQLEGCSESPNLESSLEL